MALFRIWARETHFSRLSPCTVLNPGHWWPPQQLLTRRLNSSLKGRPHSTAQYLNATMRLIKVPGCTEIRDASLRAHGAPMKIQNGATCPQHCMLKDGIQTFVLRMVHPSRV